MIAPRSVPTPAVASKSWTAVPTAAPTGAAIGLSPRSPLTRVVISWPANCWTVESSMRSVTTPVTAVPNVCSREESERSVSTRSVTATSAAGARGPPPEIGVPPNPASIRLSTSVASASSTPGWLRNVTIAVPASSAMSLPAPASRTTTASLTIVLTLAAAGLPSPRMAFATNSPTYVPTAAGLVGVAHDGVVSPISTSTAPVAAAPNACWTSESPRNEVSPSFTGWPIRSMKAFLKLKSSLKRS